MAAEPPEGPCEEGRPKPHKRRRPRRAGAKAKASASAAESATSLRRGVEWLLSDTNLSRDSWLYGKILAALPEGWIRFADLRRYPGMRAHAGEPEVVRDSLRDSHLEAKIEEKGRRLWVRRRVSQLLPPLLCGETCLLDAGKGSVMKVQPCLDRYQTKNRLRDLLRVAQQLGVDEVGDGSTVFFERVPGQQQRFGGAVIAVGYERVVYGDGGPYVELSEKQVQWKAWPHFFDKSRYNATLKDYYYDEYYTAASHSRWQEQWNRWARNPFDGVLMLYAQKQDVHNRPWAPGGGSDHAYRPNGYADYRPGYYYLAADESLIEALPEGRAP